LGPIKDDGKALTWEVGGITVRAAYAMLDGSGKAMTPKIVIQPEPLKMNSLEYYRAFIQSPPDLLNGSLELRFVPTGEPTVPPTPVDPPPPPPVDPPPPVVDTKGVILDDRAAKLTGEWLDWKAGYDGNLYYTYGGNATATYSFTVEPGKYRVAATWPAHENRATNAAYTLTGGPQTLTVKVDQKPAPASFTAGGVPWHTLGEVTVAGTKLTVLLDSKGTDGHVIADALRIERIGDLPSTDREVRGVIRGKTLTIELP
jgi:hypothetical protein